MVRKNKRMMENHSRQAILLHRYLLTWRLGSQVPILWKLYVCNLIMKRYFKNIK
jgi:hypothetical protein